MSSVSNLMRERVLPSGRADDEGTTLADLDRGHCGVVVGYAGDVEASAARRLFDLGLVPGVEVTMVRRAPLRDPVIFRVGDYEIALRSVQARGVRVEPVR